MTRRVVVLALGVAVTLGGCGNGGGESDDAAPSVSEEGQVVPGVAMIELAPVEAGARPSLQWRDTPGVELYYVTVSVEGRPYWTWQGRAITTLVGGGPGGAGEDVHAARLAGPAEWFVIGIDSDDNVVAASERGVIPGPE